MEHIQYLPMNSKISIKSVHLFRYIDLQPIPADAVASRHSLSYIYLSSACIQEEGANKGADNLCNQYNTIKYHSVKLKMFYFR